MLKVIICHITVPPEPSVSIMSSGPSTAGLPHSLTCSVIVVPGLVAGPTLTWEGRGVGQDGVELSGEASSSPLSLSFTQLLTSHGGVYTCTASLTISEARVDISGSNMTTVAVQSM